jgi:hypothetical protein
VIVALLTIGRSSFADGSHKPHEVRCTNLAQHFFGSKFCQNVKEFFEL